MAVGTNTFTKSNSAGDVVLDNGGTDTPAVTFYYANNSNWGIDSYNNGSNQILRFVLGLNETGGSQKAYIDTSGNFWTAGSARPQTFDAGQHIKTTIWSNSDMGFNSNYTNATATYTTIASKTYTPAYNTSYIFVEVYARYYVNGAAEDSFFSQLTWNGAEFAFQREYWANGAGGGSRTSKLFPLAGRITNGLLTGYTLAINCRRDSSDDTITVYADAAFWVKITEVAR
jgi:hypothetical protein